MPEVPSVETWTVTAARPISRKQQLVLDVLQKFVAAHDRCPSIRELADALSLGTSTVHGHLHRLERLGLVEGNGGAHSFRPSRNRGKLLGEQVNAAPEPLRSYVYELEARADPPGTVRELFVARETVAALKAKLDAISRGAAP